MINDILLIVGVWIASALLHEYGHYAIAKKYDKTAKIVFTLKPFQLYTYMQDSIFYSLKKEQKESFYINGILVGAIPLFAYMIMYQWLGFMFMIIYLLPIKSDLLQLWRIDHGKI